MIPRQKMESLIRKKEEQIQELEGQLREAKAYLQALQDMFRFMPKEVGGTQAHELLRPGSAMSKARNAIRQAGRPLHISEIVTAIGKENTKRNRISLGGSLAGYVRKRAIFARSAPNTFALIEMESNLSGEEEPPEDFGIK